MSGSRAERLQRLLAVQERKRQMEEWRIAELKREELALAESNIDILRSLGDQSLLHGLFLDSKVSTLRRNDLETAANQANQIAAMEKLREAQGAEKRLERAAREAAGSEQRVRESDDLVAVLEDFMMSRG